MVSRYRFPGARGYATRSSPASTLTDVGLSSNSPPPPPPPPPQAASTVARAASSEMVRLVIVISTSDVIPLSAAGNGGARTIRADHASAQRFPRDGRIERGPEQGHRALESSNGSTALDISSVLFF